MRENSDHRGIKRTLPGGVKIGYSTTGFGGSMTFTLFFTYGMLFFTDTVGFDPAFAGMLFAIGSLWDAFTDPVVGIWSDNLKGKERRRPFLIGVAVPFGLVSWLLFTDFGLSDNTTKIYFSIVVLVFFTVQTLLDVPYTALGAELTLDYDERSSLNSLRTLFGIVAAIFSIGTLPIVGMFSELAENEKWGWSLMSAFFAFFCTITILIGWRTTRGYERFGDRNVRRVCFKDVSNGPLKNRPFRYITGLFAFGVVAQALAGMAGLYYMKYFMGFDDVQISIALACIWIPGIGFVGLINFISQKISKKAAWLISMGLWAASCHVFVMYIIKPGFPIPLYIANALSAMGFVALYQVTWAMIPDCVEVDEYKTGERREGLYYGLATFTQKVSAAIALLIGGVVLKATGYVPNAEQTPRTLKGIIYLFGVIIPVFLVLSIICAYLNPLNRTNHRILREIIQAKKQNREHDLGPIESLIR